MASRRMPIIVSMHSLLRSIIPSFHHSIPFSHTKRVQKQKTPEKPGQNDPRDVISTRGNKNPPGAIFNHELKLTTQFSRSSNQLKTRQEKKMKSNGFSFSLSFFDESFFFIRSQDFEL